MFAVDDELEASAKHEALDELPPERRSRAFECWLRLGAACRKRGNGGLVTSALLSKILHTWKPAERARAAQDLVDARGGRSQGLWVAEGDGFRFHEWERWNPSAEEAEAERASVSAEAIRSRRYRMNKKAAKRDAPRDDERDGERDASRPSVTHERDGLRDDERDGERDDSVSRARSARATRVRDPIPVPSRPSQREISAQGRVSDQVAPARADPRDTLASAWRVGFVRRFERSGVGLTHAGPAGRDMAALIDAALAQPDPPAFVERALDGFFGTPRMASMRPAFAPRFLAEDPVGYAACSTTPVGSTDARNAELVAGIPRLEVT